MEGDLLLDKNKIYCNHCYKEHRLTELKVNEENGLVDLCSIHNNLKSNFYILVYKEEHKDFVAVRGRNPHKNAEIDKPKATGKGLCSICRKEN